MKLADFGLSSWRDYQSTHSKTTTAQGTITHIAPEKWENPAIKPRERQDVYALGMLTWELFSEKTVFEGNSRDLIIQYIRDGKRPSVDDMGAGVPSKLKELVQSCWAQEESQRPTVIEIKSSLEGIVTNIEEDITRAKSKLLAAIKESSDKENDELREEPVPEDVGEHSSNPHSEVACSAALKDDKMHPKFTVKPKDKDVKEGDKAEFHATAKGKPIPEITWFKGDELIKSTDRVTITSNEVHGDQTSTLTIHNAKITDSCELRACAKNTSGEDNCTAKLSASQFATHGSYLARDSGTTLHLCKIDGSYTDTVRAIRPAAVVWGGWDDLPSVPGVEVLRVGRSWDTVVRGLQDAESRGHKTVAVVSGWWGSSINSLSDHAAARRDNAATDVWLLRCDTDGLSVWQQQMDKDSRYSRIK